MDDKITVKGFSPFLEFTVDSGMWNEPKADWIEYDTEVKLSFSLTYADAKALLELLRKTDPRWINMEITLIKEVKP